MELDEVKTKSAQLSPWAYIATVGADGRPDVVPVHPGWEGDVLWLMCGVASVKARNVAANPNVALHWHINSTFDGLELWGTATVHDDLETKRRVWTGVFDFDLDAFAPGGPDNSPDTAFMAVRPVRALWLATYGMAGSDRWRAQ